MFSDSGRKECASVLCPPGVSQDMVCLLATRMPRTVPAQMSPSLRGKEGPGKSGPGAERRVLG